MKQHISAGRLMAMAFAVAAALLPALALAQGAPTASDFEPESADMTNFMLRSIFGDWNSGQEVPLLGAPMKVLNIFALTFGTLMFTYVAVIGTLNTAQDGEVLGKKWSSMWVPLRFVFGTALLVPLASGYSTVQHLILWLALVGGGAASQVWTAALEGFTSPARTAIMVMNSEDYSNKVKSLMRDLLKSEACVAYLGTTYPNSFGTTGPTPLPSATEEQMGPGSVYVPGFKYEWGAVGSGGSGKSADECGMLRTTSFTDTVPSSGSIGLAYGDGGGTSMASGTLPDVGSTALLETSYKAMARSQVEGIDAALLQLRPTAMALASAAAPGGNAPVVTSQRINNALEAAKRAYLQKVAVGRNAVAQASNAKLAKFMTASEESGWMMASSSFFQMGRIKSAANAAIGALPEASGRTDPLTMSGKAPYGIAEGPLYEDLAAADSRITEAFSSNSTTGVDFVDNFGENAAMYMGRVFGVNPSSDKHALVQIKDTGDKLLLTVEAFAAASLTSIAGGSAVSNSPVGKTGNWLTGAFDTMKEVFWTLLPALYAGIIAMFGVAITMSFLLPMLPFMLSIGSILGWLMAVFSALVAAPIWLAGHLHPEGDGFAGKGVGGYMILLETVTRPIFIVFGLIGAFVIMDPMLKFVAWAFRANMSSLQGNSITGLVSIVVFAAIYVAIVWTVVRQSLQLIFALSEKVYTWIGGANAGYEQARDFGSAAQGSTGAAATSLQGVGATGAAALRTRRSKLAEERAGREEKNQAGANRSSSDGAE